MRTYTDISMVTLESSVFVFSVKNVGPKKERKKKMESLMVPGSDAQGITQFCLSFTKDAWERASL